jgi:hypothetical protein
MRKLGENFKSASGWKPMFDKERSIAEN